MRIQFRIPYFSAGGGIYPNTSETIEFQSWFTWLKQFV